MSQQTIKVTNPATGELLAEIPSHTFKDGKAAIERAKRAQKKWATTTLSQRIEILRRLSELLVENAHELCELISKENGKPLVESMSNEIFPAVDLINYFCKRAPKILENKSISMHLLKYRRSYIHFKPRGLLFVISPWNFPLSIPVGSIIMGLLAGNVIIHKPASLTPLIALKLRELFDEAGLDPDVYQVLPMAGSTAFKLIAQGVDYVNFTGSTAVGEQIAAECGRLLVPCSMELGGKDPAIVCADADVDHAVGSLVWGAFANAGQICASVERAYVHESIYDRVVASVVEKVEGLKVGNALEDNVSMGPITDPRQLELLAEQVEHARAEGANILTGGTRLEGPGQFYAPTVMVDVHDEMECVQEETFGPTLPIMKFTDEADAIERANNSHYGLNAYVFSKDKARARKIAEQLEAGTVMINEVLITHAIPETPWSGIKQSGIGRVHSDEGLRDLCIPHHVNYDLVQPSRSPFWQPYSHASFLALKGVVTTLFGKGLSGRLQGLKDLLAAGPELVADSPADHRTKNSAARRLRRKPAA